MPSAYGSHQVFDPIETSSKPKSESTFVVLDGTLSLNQGLSDRRFAIDYGLDASTRQGVNKADAAPRQKAARVADIESKIQRELAKAEKAKDLLVATNPNDENWNFGGSLLLGVGGLTAFALATYLRRRLA